MYFYFIECCVLKHKREVLLKRVLHVWGLDVHIASQQKSDLRLHIEHQREE